MSDLSRSLNQYLSQHNVRSCEPPPHLSSLHDEFLKEAYRINDHISSLRKYLLSIRRAYLSSAPPSRRPHRTTPNQSTPGNGNEPPYLNDSDKESIDANSKSFLRDLAASLTQLASAESVRRETSSRIVAQKYDKGFLGKWAAGSAAGEKSLEQSLEEGKLETLKTVRESIIWFLQKRLEDAGHIQRGMMERRLEREIEKGRSVLYQARGNRKDDSPTSIGRDEGSVAQSSGPSSQSRYGVRAADMEIEDEARREIEQQLSPEQLQLFAKENNDMLKQYEDTMDQVRTAERSMLEISELQTQLAQNLDIQSANISQLVADSLSTTENVGGGNKQLKRATERSSRARMVFFSTCGLCGFLIIWDLIF